MRAATKMMRLLAEECSLVEVLMVENRCCLMIQGLLGECW